MEITKRAKDYVYFSTSFKRYYPKVYNELTKILSKHKVCYGILGGTLDYWCRDYMPVQICKNTFVHIADEMRSRLESHFEVIDLELSNYHSMSWAYINMIHTQNVIIVPGVVCSTDAEALDHIKKLFPEYEGRIYQVQMQTLVKRGGALNCLSWTCTK